MSYRTANIIATVVSQAVAIAVAVAIVAPVIYIVFERSGLVAAAACLAAAAIAWKAL